MSTHEECNTDTWSDIDDLGVCGDCLVLAHDMDDTYRTCDAYCQAQDGLECVNAWEEAEGCTKAEEHGYR
eukprot:UN06320